MVRDTAAAVKSVAKTDDECTAIIVDSAVLESLRDEWQQYETVADVAADVVTTGVSETEQLGRMLEETAESESELPKEYAHSSSESEGEG